MHRPSKPWYHKPSAPTVNAGSKIVGTQVARLLLLLCSFFPEIVPNNILIIDVRGRSCLHTLVAELQYSSWQVVLSPCRIASNVRVSAARAAVLSGGDKEREDILNALLGAQPATVVVVSLIFNIVREAAAQDTFHKKASDLLYETCPPQSTAVGCTESPSL